MPRFPFRQGSLEFKHLLMFFPTASGVNASMTRTMVVRRAGIRTVFVRLCARRPLGCLLVATLSLCGLSMPVLAEAPVAGDARAQAAQRQAAEQGWLTLEREQAIGRRRLAPEDPAAARALGTVERQEDLRLRGLNADQAAELRAGERSRRAAGVDAPPAADAQLRGRLMEQGRERDAVRLHRQMNRKIHGVPSTLGPGRGR